MAAPSCGIPASAKGPLEPPAVQPALTAIWTPGLDSPALPPDPFLMSLNPDVRADIVALTCGVNPGAKFPAIPAKAELFLLSSLGASVNIRGDWPSSPTSSLIGWQHRATIGRDSYVRVVNAGFAFPSATGPSTLRSPIANYSPIANPR